MSSPPTAYLSDTNTLSSSDFAQHPSQPADHPNLDLFAGMPSQADADELARRFPDLLSFPPEPVATQSQSVLVNTPSTEVCKLTGVFSARLTHTTQASSVHPYDP